ncbi:MAG: hypothetical protein EXS52_00905 [Candidatus Staskawiczbacteria bacterium]|nr:hypothetical protein [Candidatus Staskawiczbacteria bacterium]
MLVLIIATIGGFWGIWPKSICLAESQYYCIGIDAVSVKGFDQQGLGLRLDKLIHSYIYPASFDPFGDGYTRLFGNFISYKFNRQDSFKVLMIGGGGYVMARYVVANYPNATVTVLEIDPKVTQINFEKLGLVPDDRMKTINGDARSAINNLGDETFDIVFADAFNDLTVPFHLTTQEMLLMVKKHLAQNGIYAMNIVDIPATGRFLASNLTTISSVFSGTYLFPLREEWYNIQLRETLVVAALNEPMNEKKWSQVIPVNDPLWAEAPTKAKAAITYHIPAEDETLLALIKKNKGIILRDDYAPAENMLAKVYRLNY